MKSDMLKYKGYQAAVAYDQRDRIFIGEVFGLKDSLNFHGKSIDELEKAFHDCIDNYLDICARIGKAPEKLYTGSFNVRIAPVLHEKATVYGAENGYSLNQVVSMAVEEFLEKQ